MKIILVLVTICYSLYALEVSEKLFECTEIFKSRKSELLVELERIDEQKQALGALQIATENLLNKKEAVINQKEEEVNDKLIQITQKEENIKKMVEKNEAILKDLSSKKMNKISQTYSKMKPSAAAKVLSEMPLENAGKILASLKAKSVGKILTKIDSKKASELTLFLTR